MKLSEVKKLTAGDNLTLTYARYNHKYEGVKRTIDKVRSSDMIIEGSYLSFPKAALFRDEGPDMFSILARKGLAEFQNEKVLEFISDDNNHVSASEKAVKINDGSNVVYISKADFDACMSAAASSFDLQTAANYVVILTYRVNKAA